MTSYTYTFFPGTCAVQQRVTVLPVISAAQNGSGTANTRFDVYDPFGNLVWQMDERGFITNMSYDIATGAMIRRIEDVDTTVTPGAPPGWVTPAGGGLNLVTDFTIDDEGRTIQVLGPSHVIDLGGVATTVRRATWTVYQDDTHQIWTGQGYATGAGPSYSYTLINPVAITIMDSSGKTLEMIQATRSYTSGQLLPSDSFPQSSYTRWTTMQYGGNDLVASQRVYHTIPASGQGASGTNYDQSDFDYDIMLRTNKQVTAGGTITRTVFDVRNNAVSIWVGTNDAGATDADPTGGANPANNMVIITGNVFDFGLSGGDNNLTKVTQYVDWTTTRETQFLYDWRNRRSDTDGEIDFYQKDYFDNLNRLIQTDRLDTTAAGTLIGRSQTSYDDLSRVYRTVRFGVDPATGTVGNALIDNTWFDPSGNVVKSQPSGAALFTKMDLDGVGRQTAKFVGFDVDETEYPWPVDVSDDTILEQAEMAYDDAGNVIQTTSRLRYHNATGTGALGDPTSIQPKARVIYQAAWQDGIGRTVASADYGTNDGSSLVRPATIPARSDTCLVTSNFFNSAGDLQTITDPAAIVTFMGHDDVGRETTKILNYQTSSSSSSSSSSWSSSSSSSSSTEACPPSADVNITTFTSYTPDGDVATITAVNSATGNQVTTFVYGTTLTDSAIATSNLKRAEIYPDSVDGSDKVTFAYDRQRGLIQQKDQNNTVHTNDFDKLGRPVQDRVTVLGAGVDGAVLRIATTYEVRGMVSGVTSFDNATAGSGNVVNDVQMVYNEFSQLIAEYQSHSGAVDMATTPRVQYGYADGSQNTIRQTSLTYPNSQDTPYPDTRVVTYSYGSPGEINDSASRVASIIDTDRTTHLVDYSYLGAGSFVITNSPEPQLQYTLVGISGGVDPDTGDIYRGLDRFGRIKDLIWLNTGSGQILERLQHGYDRAGNRLYRAELADVLRENDELYVYDRINRLNDLYRGTLNGPKNLVGALNFAQCWTLDETCNWSGFRADDSGNGWNLIQDREFNKANQIQLITSRAGVSWATPLYRPSGNIFGLPNAAGPMQRSTLVYDAWNRLVKAEYQDVTVGTYAYDGQGRRVLRSGNCTTGGYHATVTYYSADWQDLEHRPVLPNAPSVQFVWGLRYVDDLLLRDCLFDRDANVKRLYSTQDANWNVTAICDVTAVRERYSYAAYGSIAILDPDFHARTSSSYGWQHLFAGYLFDSETSTYTVRRRQFSPSLGVWLQRDSVHLGPNLYAYLNGAPINSTDPTGQLAWIPLLIIGAILTTTVSSHDRPQELRRQVIADEAICGGQDFRIWRGRDWYKCFACCVEKYNLSALIVGGSLVVGARVPKRTVAPGQYYSTSAWVRLAARRGWGREATALARRLGRIGVYTIVAEGVYSLAEMGCCGWVCR